MSERKCEEHGALYVSWDTADIEDENGKPRCWVCEIEAKAEEYHNQYHLCEAKLLSHQSIIRQMQEAHDELVEALEVLHKTFSLCRDTNNRAAALDKAEALLAKVKPT